MRAAVGAAAEFASPARGCDAGDDGERAPAKRRHAADEHGRCRRDWISAASVWEIAIKHAVGRGDMPVSSQDAVRYFRESGYRFLAIEPEHPVAVDDLAAHHQDPFDRILVAQALVEPMRLMAHDPLVALYSDTIIQI